MTNFDICNLALLNIGSTRTISNFADNSAEAQLCNRCYDIAKAIVLKAYEWNFATITADLVAVTVSDETNDTEDANDSPKDPHQLVYEYPDDALKIVSINRNRDFPFKIITEIVDSETVKHIACDIPNAQVTYISDIDESAMTPDFVEALAWKLASMIGVGLSKAPNITQYALQMYGMALNVAKRNDSQEQSKMPEIPRYIRARGGWRHGF